MTLRRLLLLLPLALILLIAGSWYWLLHTEHGANRAWSIAVSAAGDALAADSVSGNLSAGVTIHRLTFSNDGVDVSISEMTAAIDIDLLSRSIRIDPAQAHGVNVQIKEGDDSAPPTQTPDLLRGLQLPLELIFPELAIRNISVTGASDSDPLLVEWVTLSGRWENEIRVDELEFRSPLADGRGSARLALVDPHDLTLDINVTAQPALTGQNMPIAVRADLKSDFQSVNVRTTRMAELPLAAG
jgi:hypothetical protein